MTVKELKEQLNKYSDDMEVVYENYGYYDVESLTKIWIDNLDNHYLLLN